MKEIKRVFVERLHCKKCDNYRCLEVFFMVGK